MAVEDLVAAPVGVPRRTGHDRKISLASRFATGLDRVLAAERPAVWEFGFVIAAVFLLGRYPVLFARGRLASLFGGGAGLVWQNDLVMQGTFFVLTVVAARVAVRYASTRSLLRQPALLAVIAIAWFSVAWSVDPGVTARRAVLFAGAAIVGWYFGDRFSLQQQVASVAGVAAIGLALSVLAFFVWPDIALTTKGHAGEWSGIYINRNILGWVLSYGLLAAGILFLTVRRWRLPLLALMAVELFVLWRTGTRTGPVGLGVAIAVLVLVALVRAWGARLIKGWAGALACVGVIVVAAGFVHWHWVTIIEALGRQERLTGRTALWEITRWLSRLRPWEGFGFEAVWSHQKTAQQITTNFGEYPFSAHNGYYDFLLGTGRIGLAFLLLFLAVAAWRAFIYAWKRRDALSLWPLAFITFAVVISFSESLFVSSEAVWALTVAAAVSVAKDKPLPA